MSANEGETWLTPTVAQALAKSVRRPEMYTMMRNVLTMAATIHRLSILVDLPEYPLSLATAVMNESIQKGVMVR
jgi:hypothetical protein